MVRFANAALGAALLLASSLPASAGVCGPRANMLAELQGKYGESVVGLGVTVDGRGLVELHKSPKGTFTITVTDPEKMTCALLAGENWQGPLPDDDAAHETKGEF